MGEILFSVKNTKSEPVSHWEEPVRIMLFWSVMPILIQLLPGMHFEGGRGAAELWMVTQVHLNTGCEKTLHEMLTGCSGASYDYDH